MSKLSEHKLLSGRSSVMGAGVGIPVPIQLDPVEYEGIMVYGDDQNVYYSDGATWRIPASAIPISRPAALVPTDALTQTQLRLSRFFSSTGEFQAGAQFEVSLSGDFVSDKLFTRTLSGDDISLYQILHPDDGLQPGQSFYWRAFYIGSEGSQSDYSLPFQQTFPDLISAPQPVTREGAVVGLVEVTPFESPSIFGLIYHETQTEFYSADGSTLITSVTHNNGTITQMPSGTVLPEGEIYQFRTRYGGRTGPGAAVVYSPWSELRSFFNGGGSMLLEYDLTLAATRTVYLPLGMYDASGMNVTVNWGDGTIQTFTTGGSKSHVYPLEVDGQPVGPIVNVTISGTLKQFGGNANQQGLRRVVNWGFKLGLTSLREALRGTTGTLQYVQPSFPTTVTSLQGFAYGYGAAVNANLHELDVSKIQNMSEFFAGGNEYAGDLSGWDLSSCTSLAGAFSGVASYSSPFPYYGFNNASIAGWNVSNVRDISYLIRDNLKFNIDISNWNVSNVTNMSWAFSSFNDHRYFPGPVFNKPLEKWNTSNVTNMSYMFAGASSFNQPLRSSPTTGWNTSKVTNMEGMFGYGSGGNQHRTVVFNQDIGSWDVSKVVNMGGMFTNSAFNNGNSDSIRNWNTASLTTVLGGQGPVFESQGIGMFSRCPFNQPLDGWNVSGVTNFGYQVGRRGFILGAEGMFSYNTAFNQNIGGWNVSAATSMAGMFAGCSAFNNGGSQSINSWNVSNVVNFGGTPDAGNGSYIGNGSAGMFYAATSFNQPLNGWNVSKGVNFTGMFCNASAFAQDLSSWNISNATGMNYMFFGATSFNFSLENWKIRLAGAEMKNFGLPGMNAGNYSRTLIGWANHVASNNAPFSISVAFTATRNYNATDFSASFPGARFTDAVSARAFLVGARSLSVANATNATANGSYAYNSTNSTYLNATSGWYFIRVGNVWQLRDGSGTIIDSSSGNQSDPYLETGWTTALLGATILRTGAVWTITGDAQA